MIKYIKKFYQFNESVFSDKYSSVTDFDTLFIEKIHLDELVIYFDFFYHNKFTIRQKNYLYYFYNNIELFCYNKKMNNFYITEKLIMNFKEYNLEFSDIRNDIKKIFEKIFNINNTIIYKCHRSWYY